MEYSDLATIAGFAFLYSLIASRLEQSRLNGALVYVLAGFVFSNHLLGWVDLEIDGGIKVHNARECAEAGVEVFVAGSAVFRGGSVDAPDVYGANIRAIRDAATG